MKRYLILFLILTLCAGMVSGCMPASISNISGVPTDDLLNSTNSSDNAETDKKDSKLDSVVYGESIVNIEDEYKDKDKGGIQLPENFVYDFNAFYTQLDNERRQDYDDFFSRTQLAIPDKERYNLCFGPIDFSYSFLVNNSDMYRINVQNNTFLLPQQISLASNEGPDIAFYCVTDNRVNNNITVNIVHIDSMDEIIGDVKHIKDVPDYLKQMTRKHESKWIVESFTRYENNVFWGEEYSYVEYIMFQQLNDEYFLVINNLPVIITFRNKAAYSTITQPQLHEFIEKVAECISAEKIEDTSGISPFSIEFAEKYIDLGDGIIFDTSKVKVIEYENAGAETYTDFIDYELGLWNQIIFDTEDDIRYILAEKGKRNFSAKDFEDELNQLENLISGTDSEENIEEESFITEILNNDLDLGDYYYPIGEQGNYKGREVQLIQSVRNSEQCGIVFETNEGTVYAVVAHRAPAFSEFTSEEGKLDSEAWVDKLLGEIIIFAENP